MHDLNKTELHQLNLKKVEKFEIKNSSLKIPKILYLTYYNTIN